MSPLHLLRRIIPRRWLRVYHRALALMAAWWYGHPSRRMVVVGVTGTDGKTTTATMIADLLTAGGYTVGLSSSVWMQIGTQRWLNETHMTMPGRFALQRLLRRMAQSGVTHVVLEVSSEGLLQHRHRGIDFDGAVITNISPEHLQSHGSFEAYRNTKGRLFNQIVRGGDKHIGGLEVEKFSVVNLDDPEAGYFLKFWASQHHGLTLRGAAAPKLEHGQPVQGWIVEHIQPHTASSDFTLNGHPLTVSVPGEFNVANAALASVVASILGVDWTAIANGLREFRGVPGRLERLALPNGAEAVVDYALTPVALTQLYATLRPRARRLIGVFGAAGGGRDAWKRPELGKIAAEYCDQIILTTDDPYDESPQLIAEAIWRGIPAAAQAKTEIILDRRAAIQQALRQATDGDVVAVTGMGSETSMIVRGKRLPWSDVQVVRELSEQTQ